MKKATLSVSNKVLLACGIVLGIYYTALHMLVPFLWSEYSIVDHTVSELSAIGAPTRTLWLWIGWPYAVLFAFFGWGIVRTAGKNRWLRLAGWVTIAYGIFNLYWPPMHTREILAAGGGTTSDTLHLVWAGVSVLFFILIMGLVALGLSWKFRIYTIISVILLIIFGSLTSALAPNVEKNLPTPMAGVWERVNVSVFLLWVAVLSVILLKRQGFSFSSLTFWRK